MILQGTKEGLQQLLTWRLAVQHQAQLELRGESGRWPAAVVAAARGGSMLGAAAAKALWQSGTPCAHRPVKRPLDT